MELKERLRDYADRIVDGELVYSDHVHGGLLEAADRIEALEGALRDIIDAYDWWQVDPVDRAAPDSELLHAKSILSNKGDSDRAAALSELAENDAYILDHENAALKARGIE